MVSGRSSSTLMANMGTEHTPSCRQGHTTHGDVSSYMPVHARAHTDPQGSVRKCTQSNPYRHMHALLDEPSGWPQRPAVHPPGMLTLPGTCVLPSPGCAHIPTKPYPHAGGGGGRGAMRGVEMWPGRVPAACRGSRAGSVSLLVSSRPGGRARRSLQG